MITQQGQIIKLKARGADDKPLRAYRFASMVVARQGHKWAGSQAKERRCRG